MRTSSILEQSAQKCCRTTYSLERLRFVASEDTPHSQTLCSRTTQFSLKYTGKRHVSDSKNDNWAESCFSSPDAFINFYGSHTKHTGTCFQVLEGTEDAVQGWFQSILFAPGCLVCLKTQLCSRTNWRKHVFITALFLLRVVGPVGVFEKTRALPSVKSGKKACFGVT